MYDSQPLQLPQEVFNQAKELHNLSTAKNAEAYQLELEAGQIRHEAAAATQQLMDLINPYQRSLLGPWIGGGGSGIGLPGSPSPGLPSPGLPSPGFPSPGLPGIPSPGFPSPGFPSPGLPGTPQPGSPIPGQPGAGLQQPSSPPPAYIPPKPFTAQGYAFVDPGAISFCVFKFTYMWLTNGDQFWFFPIFVGPNSIAGFRWGRFGWRYYGIDLRLVDAFTCS